MARGVYSGTRRPPTPARPIVVAAVRVPSTVVTGPAALFLHGLLDSPSAEVWLAISANARPPRVGPPVRFIWSAVLDPEVLLVEGVQVRVASVERAISDCVRRPKLVPPRVVEMAAVRMAVPTTPAPEGAAAA